MKIGVISDTHGLLRPEAVDALRGSNLILHAGDIGKRTVLNSLEKIAPVVAVRGNIDSSSWGGVPLTRVVEAGTLTLYMLHNICDLDLKPEVAGFAAVIYGHSHRPEIRRRKGVVFFNPGSAGPRRFRLPVSVGRIEIAGNKLSTQLIRLKIKR